MFDLRMPKRWMYAALWVASILALVADFVFGRKWLAVYFDF
jgi:hypothetical protein